MHLSQNSRLQLVVFHFQPHSSTVMSADVPFCIFRCLPFNHMFFLRFYFLKPRSCNMTWRLVSCNKVPLPNLYNHTDQSTIFLVMAPRCYETSTTSITQPQTNTHYLKTCTRALHPPMKPLEASRSSCSKTKRKVTQDPRPPIRATGSSIIEDTNKFHDGISSYDGTRVGAL